ncbi:inositol 2-dehydrogenase [Mycobacterium sp. 852013-50091_SCH5140682]|uniref:Gfo/Idh/MocA family protein n=1 Tax=Mycobacterium sp. 852013-50091_SCH5140682 TaxID=1834109 RepID=UPI0007EB42D8|nr:Gfo/Idh/MocA family oxidoreductase [Mycobacterium sp. 852013-50091_SCH5140682]OBC15412.1 inositol 2-dehydrogenase [Mycobacterium sp. 852013-50091_SCH5140682]
MNQPIRFGLIGTGRIGRMHAANIFEHPETVLASVADPVVDGAADVAARYGGTVTDSPEELIESGGIDAVLVASPTPTHVELIEACVDAGLPVLCEKPIDLDIACVDALRPKVAESDVPVALGINQRFDPAFAEVHARVRDGQIGELEQLAIVSRDPAPPPADYIAVSGGIFRDMTIHDFEMARFFVGDIVEVSATGARLFDSGAREHGDFDTIAVTLRAARGALVTITNSRHSAIGYDQRLEAFGANGVLQVANAPTSLVSFSCAGMVESRSPYVEPFLERYARAYALELVEFVKLVRGERSSSPTFEDGRAALLIADAAQRSATMGEAVGLDLS